MGIAIIFGLIFFCFSSGLAFLVFYLPTKWLVKTDSQRTVRLGLSVLMGLLIPIFYLFVSPENNNKTATIEKMENSYLVTVTGKRSYMVHDPISYLKRGTFLDSFEIIIPRAEGVINGQEIPRESGHYKILGKLTIVKEKMILDLYFDNTDDKIKDPLNWNGDYELQWIGNK